MTLPTGAISFSQVNVEITRPSTQQLDLNDSTVRTLAGVGGSGTAISMSNLQGKTFSTRTSISLVISSDYARYDVYTERGPTYVPGTSDITVTINPGVRVYGFGAPPERLPGLRIPNQFSPGDTVRIVNQGTIVGKGGGDGLNFGKGANSPQSAGGATPAAQLNGESGGDAIQTQRPVTIDNFGIIAGGGGGGGGGAFFGPYPATLPRPPRQGGPTPAFLNMAGGGGGGGAGLAQGLGGVGGSSSPAPISGGTPGGTGQMPGPAGTGGTPIYATPGGTLPPTQQGKGGDGGALGSAGQAGQATPLSTTVGTGGTAGRYIVGNPLVTWQNTGTRQGGVA
jgi:hypothetical protein